MKVYWKSIIVNVCFDFICKKLKCIDYVDDLSDIFVFFVNFFILYVVCMIIVVKF